jgi:hypothetical protein
MMNKLNLSVLEDYSKKYARVTADQFFASQAIISGNQILAYSKISQVNLFILHHLFAAWQEEIARLQSPYFDYQTIEVKEALKQFMNTVSRHIAVKREHFEPLVISATVSTLKLILEPHSYFEELLRKDISGKVSIQQLKEAGRYIQVHKSLYQAIVDKIENRHAVELNLMEATSLLNEVYEDKQSVLEKPETYIEQFSSIVPLSATSLYTTDTSLYTTDTSLPVHTQPPVQEEPALVPKEQPTAPLVNLQVDIEQFVKAAHVPPTPLVSIPVEPVKVTANTAPVNLNAKFTKEQMQATLNDRLKQAPQTTLLDRHQKAKVTDLKSAISLNQKFLFINALFRGDNTTFNQALQELEKCLDYASALDLLQEKYAQKYSWDFESEEVSSFLEIVGRKF